MKKLLLISTSVVSMALSSFAVSIDTSETGNWNGWMNVFEKRWRCSGGYYLPGGEAVGGSDLNSTHILVAF